MNTTKPSTKLELELARVINVYSEENRSDTADWILANYLIACLDAYNSALFSREIQSGRKTAEELLPKINRKREEAPIDFSPSVT